MIESLKCRGKRVDNGELIYGFYCWVGYTGNQKDYIIPYDASAFYGIEIVPGSLNRYSGWKDKNGKEIFEGDICKDDNGTIIQVFLLGIKQRQEEWFYKIIKGFDGAEEFIFPIWRWDTSIKDTYSSFEIIGNIHDNPELIETEV